MILLITNRLDYTADFVVLELQRRQIEYFRLNTEDIAQFVQVYWLVESFSDSYFDIGGRKIYLKHIKSIWYRRPVAPTLPILSIQEQEFVIQETMAAFGGIWRSLDCFWVSHPDKLFMATFKAYQLSVAQKLGFKLPKTIITNMPDKAKEFHDEHDIVYKPLKMKYAGDKSSGKFIFTNRVSDYHLTNLDSIILAPCQFQEFIDKAFDIRVTVIGRKLFAVAIHSQIYEESQIDWRKGEVINLPHTVITLPVDVEHSCLRLVNELGLEFGAIDLIKTHDGDYIFLEINGNGQWAWIEQLTGLSLTGSLVDLLVNGA